MASDASSLLLLTCVACESLLKEPVQLGCLHHCCRRCLKSVASQPKDGGGNWSLTCTACGKVTSASDLDALTENCFIAARLLLHGFRTGPVRCQFLCDDDESDDEAAAEHWCMECQKPLCAKCLRQHGKLYVTGHTVVAATALSAAVTGAQGRAQRDGSGALPLSSSSSMCGLHKKEFDFYCVQCNGLKCGTCGKACVSAGHRMQDNADRMKQAAEAVRAARTALAAAEGPVTKCTALLDDVEEARRRDADRLKSNKRAVLDAVSDAFERSELALQQLYVELADSAASLSERARRIQCGLSHALAYSDALLGVNDHVGLLQQEAKLLDCLGSLTREARSMAETDSGACVAIDVNKPADFVGILQQAIGMPRAVDQVRSSGCPTGSATIRKPSDCSTEDRRSPVVPAAVSGIQPVATRPVSGFKAGSSCQDIAITDDGRVLIADGCLKEYDISGRLVSEWTPPSVTPAGSRAGGSYKQQDKVFAIGLAGGGRVVAGMLLSCRLLLLKRTATAAVAKGPTWEVDGSEVVVPSHPVRLSASGDLCALSCADVALVTAASRCIYLMSLADRTTLLNLDAVYDISNLHLTRNMIFVSSKAKQRSWDGSQAWVVDAYSHTAERLWRHEFYGEASGICMSPLGDPSVCVAQLNRAGVIETISASGASQKAILSSKPGLSDPWLLASSRGSPGQQPLLAVVSGDSDHSVTVYRSSDFS